MIGSWTTQEARPRSSSRPSCFLATLRARGTPSTVDSAGLERRVGEKPIFTDVLIPNPSEFAVFSIKIMSFSIKTSRFL